jgi:hypothetical protein
MSKRMIGLVLSLIVSVVIGIGAGQNFFRIFDKTVPAGSMTELVRTGTHTAYLISGIVLGMVIFGWTIVASWMSRFFPAAASTGSTSSGSPTR